MARLESRTVRSPPSQETAGCDCLLVRPIGAAGVLEAYQISSPGEKLPGFPQPTHGTNLQPFTTVNEAIQRIPEGFPNHDPNSAARRNLAAYNGNLPLRNCITTGGSLDTHPNGRRGFTVRELACLQTFPLEHKFGTVGLKKQIGNAVPSLFAQVLFSHIRRWLEEADG